ncbi:stage III sporulation protein AG [Paludifilum halophilum]|uniref:stage III sporulation protein AG n=1 Tax=Paludifilum halophilum TaxID=1642702 RepID=UPI00146DC2ED|nr:stage III sporulation protein AG [Paludifilum halophilum]
MFKRLFDRIEQSIGGGEEGAKKVNTFRWLIVLGCLGVALMILSSFFSVHEETLPPESSGEKNEDEAATPAWKKKNSDSMTMKDYEAMYESELSEVLGKVVGVNDVSVMVNLDSSEKNVLEKNTRHSDQVTDETDQKGGSRKIREETRDEKVVLQRNGNGDQPIVVKKIKPQVRGVLIVAEGAENLKVKAAMIEAVQRVLDVPVHRISVMPKG